jgi:hypothetical protein
MGEHTKKRSHVRGYFQASDKMGLEVEEKRFKAEGFGAKILAQREALSGSNGKSIPGHLILSPSSRCISRNV